MKESARSALVLTVASLIMMAIGGSVWVQAGTGPNSAVPGRGDASSELVLTAEQGTETGTRRDPHSETVVPDSEQSQRSQGVAEVPPGIGEKGTGQTQSTMERSGGEQSEASPEQGTGQTHSSKERSGGQQSKSSKGMAQVPAGIGEKGTGQTQSTMERSGGE